ncbi:sulfatase-like hydrolase/transferase [Acinetobacter terrae]|uniref:Sulfatase-like hydrolase/transferase n=1 Tax=Acinetobacter terrae TaxID=2731247 RepID=A0A8E4GM26_9GAMM|nr:sulfatase-like hydrolase/transferase [Acinetobacter terrae]NNH38073.1 sulfatase-like hydrolase/transferase [Acinetobacter terrae]
MKQIKYIVGFSIFVNLFFVFSGYWLGLGRPIVNVDYLLLLCFCCLPKNFISNSLLLLAFFMLFSIDVLLIVLQIFPFVRLTDLMYLSGFIFNGPILYRILLLVTVCVFLISFFIIRDLFFKKIKLTIKQFALIILFAVGVLFIKHLLNPLDKDEVYARFDKTWVGSQLQFFIKHQQSSFVESMGNHATQLEPSRFKNSTQPLFEQLNSKKPLSKKILLVVNESWGETAKPADQAAILSKIYQKKNHLEFINQGAFNFVGATVAGELRELCRKQPTTFNLKDADASQFRDCLPNQLKKQGYETQAIHGAMSVMYDRSSWYPKAGFEHIRFFEQLPNAGVCRAFSGRCDVKLIPEIKNQLLASDRSFVYWMTLSTHAPYDDTLFIQGLDCTALKIKEKSETCHNYKLQYQFFSALSQLIDDPGMKGVEIYVAGDHSPPIFNLGDNFFSFKGSEVAWIHFKVK